ncbi:hypothetical protein [Methylomonas albis]|uniref:Uncharacterized protein n=1 Tax=Methylomonas albis TaxID=1854563 RepID=A0ABR9D534_9GAMM|nr:hypothetical protein [Methylomonas albis]MBD9357896.1 hypothetical protein [Methylomonas albis]CAD6881230.1 hypothetical protein [Methylomonas albis]
MTDEWIIKPKESWREETKIYHSRFEEISTISTDAAEAIKSNFPGKYWGMSDKNEKASVVSRIVIYAVNGFSYSLGLRPIIEQQFKQGQFMIVPLSTRFFFEMCGSINYAKSLISKISNKESVESELNKVNKLLTGAKSEVMLPWGELATESSINVMDFVRSLENEHSGAVESYGFLCEASHPNFVQNSYFQMAGPPVSNWDNKEFKKHGHILLNKTVSIYEQAVHNSENDILSIFKMSNELV